jgi:hypothetical protein
VWVEKDKFSSSAVWARGPGMGRPAFFIRLDAVIMKLENLTFI